MFEHFFGYLSGTAIGLSFVPYIRDIFLGKTKPERISWLIWALLGAITFSSQLAKGATNSLILPGVQAIGDFLIFILSIKYGVGGLLKRDILGMLGAGIGLAAWYLSGEATVALLSAVFIDAIGVVLTVIKTYLQPQTETVSAWILTSLGGLFGCLAVGEFNLILLFFPAYICLAGISILVTIYLGYKKRLHRSLSK